MSTNEKEIKGTVVDEEAVQRGVEEAIGIWAMYSVTGRVPEDITLEDLSSIGNTPLTLQNATSLFNGLMYKERQLIESLIDDNAVKDIILGNKLELTESDYEEAKEIRANDLAEFQKDFEAQVALAQAELAIKKDLEHKGE